MVGTALVSLLKVQSVTAGFLKDAETEIITTTMPQELILAALARFVDRTFSSFKR